jgi:FtsP/CotA-like multicopper oxidase with cupredoxin domain
LGPIIRGSVGDSVRVVFRNHGSHPYSIHPHGVFYTKSNEGAPYNDGTSGRARFDDRVLPGRTYTYRWDIPARAGPGPMDGSSVAWMYHSHVDEVQDVAAGLTGIIIVTAKDHAKADGSPRDVDREIAVMLGFHDENASWFAGENTSMFVKDTKSMKADLQAFRQANQELAINGFRVGNLPMITLQRGSRVRWYVFGGMGSDLDFHVAHWHGQTVISAGMRTDMVELPLPGSMRVADMVPDSLGTWLFHCHVPGHIHDMTALFTVR